MNRLYSEVYKIRNHVLGTVNYSPLWDELQKYFDSKLKDYEDELKANMEIEC